MTSCRPILHQAPRSVNGVCGRVAVQRLRSCPCHMDAVGALFDSFGGVWYNGSKTVGPVLG
jgi:hypothetical protein